MLNDVGRALPGVARRAILAAIAGESLVVPAEGPQAAVFVTLRSADGSLRGCIGDLAPTEPHVTRETARVAVLAATQDPRFEPLTAGELSSTSIEVSVLEPEEPVVDVAALDPQTFGVVVRDARGRRAVLLPCVPGIDSVADQLAVVRRKADIPEAEAVSLSRFRVTKFD